MKWKATHKIKLESGEIFYVMKLGKIAYLAHEWAESMAGSHEIEGNKVKKCGNTMDAKIELADEEEFEDWR